MKSAAHIVSLLALVIVTVSCSYMQRTDAGFKHADNITHLAENKTLTVLVRSDRDEFLYPEYYFHMTYIVRQCVFDAFRISDPVIIFDSYSKEVPKDKYNTDYFIELFFDEKNDNRDFMDWISLCTLMIIPSVDKTMLEMKARFHVKNTERDYHFSRKAEFKTWYHLSFMLIQFFVDGDEKLISTAKSEMIMDVLHEMNREGLFK